MFMCGGASISCSMGIVFFSWVPQRNTSVQDDQNVLYASVERVKSGVLFPYTGSGNSVTADAKLTSSTSSGVLLSTAFLLFDEEPRWLLGGGVGVRGVALRLPRLCWGLGEFVPMDPALAPWLRLSRDTLIGVIDRLCMSILALKVSKLWITFRIFEQSWAPHSS
jgi:hypothetical protein